VDIYRELIAGQRGDLLLTAVMLPVQMIGLRVVADSVYIVDTVGGSGRALDVAPVSPLAYALVVASTLVLALRSRLPIWVLGVTVAMFAAYMAIGYPVGPILLIPMAMLFTLAALGGRRRWLAGAFAVIVAASSLWAPRMFDMLGMSFTFLLTVTAFYGAVTAIFGGSVLLGALIRSWQETTEARLAEARGEADRQVTEERLRIARDVHDVVAHSMAGIAVQSASALRILNDQNPAAASALAAIREASTQALTELRATVGMLRDEAPAVPALGLNSLNELLASMRAAGLPIKTLVTGTPADLPHAGDGAAYRIVQESLTNVLRHAGPHARALLRLEYGTAELTIEITDDGEQAEAAPGGHGLHGMRERAEAAGGTLHAGPQPHGGFRVSARLPLKEAG
jgi:signal transduction histidine kinase